MKDEMESEIDEREFRRDTLNCVDCDFYDRKIDNCRSSECVYFIKSKKEMIARIIEELAEKELKGIGVRRRSALIVAMQLQDEIIEDGDDSSYVDKP